MTRSFPRDEYHGHIPPKNYKEIIELSKNKIDKKLADDLGMAMIDGFRVYIKDDTRAPKTLQHGTISVGIAKAAAYTLALTSSKKGTIVADDLKVTFLAHFEFWHKYFLKNMIKMNDDEERKIK